MKNYKILLNIFITVLLLSLVRAEDEETTTEAAEIILTPGPIVGEYKKKDLNDSYDESSSIKIQCSGNTCTTDSESVIINKGNVTISTAGTYILQGDLTGQVYISATKDDFIHLVLNNMSITSEYGPAIYEVKCDKMVITTVGENSLIDSTNYPVEEDDDDEEEESNDKTNETTEEDSTKKKSPNACLFAKSDLTFNGNGSISITGNYYEGIRCKKDLKLVSGTINVVAVEKGIKAKNSISIKEATIDVDAVDTAIKVTKDTDPEKGFVVIDGGKIKVKSGNDGIHAETHLTINDGYIDVTESKEGLEGQMIDIVGGEIYVKASDDGINASKIGAVNDEFGFPGGNFNGTMGPGGFPGGNFNDTMGGFPGGNFNDTMGPGGFPGGNFNDTMGPGGFPGGDSNDTIPGDFQDNNPINDASQPPESTSSVPLPYEIDDNETNDVENSDDEIDNNISNENDDNYDDEKDSDDNNDDNDDNENDNNDNDDDDDTDTDDNDDDETDGDDDDDDDDTDTDDNDDDETDGDDDDNSNDDNTSEEETNEDQSNKNKNRKSGHSNKKFNKGEKKGKNDRKHCYIKKVIKKSSKSKTVFTKTIYATSVIKNNRPVPTNDSSSKKYGPLPKNNSTSHKTKSSKQNNKHFGKRANTENDEQVYIKITGGKVHVLVEGMDVDGIDSNGSLYIGGNSEVYVTNSSGDIYGNMAALDAEGSNVIDVGATVIAIAGSSSMGGPGGQGGPNGQGGQGGPNGQGGPGGNMTLPDGFSGRPNESNMTQQDIDSLMQNFNQTQNGGMNGPQDRKNKNGNDGQEGHERPDGMGGGPGNETSTVKQAYINITVDNQEAGTQITVKDDDGNTIIEYEPEVAYSKILITTPKLQEGSTYTVIAGTATQTAVATIDSA